MFSDPAASRAVLSGGGRTPSATKFALEGLSEGLADEVRDFGVKVLIVEPGSFRTGLFEAGNAGISADSGVYAKVGETRAMIAAGDGSQPGDPAKAAAVIRAALAAEHTPLRLPLGDDGVSAVLGHLDQVREDVEAWEKHSRATAFDN
ncbi:oxidoreductase [Streptomyces violaceorubidus]